jgi:hypothetical protein
MRLSERDWLVTKSLSVVMPGHSASKTRVNALMCRASTSFFISSKQDVDARDKRGHDAECETHTLPFSD